MQSASEFLSRMEEEGLTEFSISANTVAEVKLAKKKLILNQKKLRQIKKEVNDTQKMIRAEYSEQNSSAGSGGSFLLSLFGKSKLAGSWRAAAKADLKAEKESALEPYNLIKNTIDELLQQLESFKIECDEYILNNDT